MAYGLHIFIDVLAIRIHHRFPLAPTSRTFVNRYTRNGIVRPNPLSSLYHHLTFLRIKFNFRFCIIRTRTASQPTNFVTSSFISISSFYVFLFLILFLSISIIKVSRTTGVASCRLINGLGHLSRRVRNSQFRMYVGVLMKNTPASTRHTH